ncbi:hypothetical protein SAMN04488535_0996 [Corynebacterium mycetoides]|uniref:MYXO-CTERM domain-containing protein n=1 Tax=Corynebacterium mycetoides TaxID=38302 RepID=A0A1G9NF46_9CORY|nr:hypothetical protein [Corynebacterium mycetoides]SDL85166.1 hypothetical protein SAMN04488535_0996 [Corynebacterium mycetoides]
MKYVHALTAVCIALSAICAAAAVLLVPGAFESRGTARILWIAGLAVLALVLALTARRLRSRP